MSAKKVNIADVPKDILGDIQALIPDTKEEYISIGTGIYTISPTSAMIVMKCLSNFMDILEETRVRKVEKLKALEIENFQPALVGVTVQDMMSDKTAQVSLTALLKDLLEGIEEDDFNKMTVGQMLDALNKAVQVNLETLPPSFKTQFDFFAASEEAPDADIEADGDESKNP